MQSSCAIQSLPNEVLMLIFSLLEVNDKLQVREVSTHFKRVVEFRGSWDGSPTAHQIIDVPKLFLHRVRDDLGNKELTLDELRERIIEIPEAISIFKIDDNEASGLEAMVDERRAKVELDHYFPATMPNFVNPLLGGVSTLATIIAGVLHAFDTPSTNASSTTCSYDTKYCKSDIQDALNIALAFYCLLGGTMGFLLKTAEIFFQDKLKVVGKSSLLPSSTSEMTSFSSRGREWLWKAFHHRDYVALATAIVVTIPLIILQPTYVEAKHCLKPSGGFNRDCLVSDVMSLWRAIGMLSTPVGLLLAYGLLTTLGLFYNSPKKLTQTCHGLFGSSKPESVDERTVLVPSFKSISSEI